VQNKLITAIYINDII